MTIKLYTVTAMLCLSAACTQSERKQPEPVVAFVGAQLIDGTGRAPVNDAVLLVSNGTIIDVGTDSSMTVPEHVEIIDFSGKTIIPGLINAHGHIGGTEGLTSSYSEQNVIRDLKLNSAYGVTTVYSLGGDGPESVAIRDEQDTINLNRSRLYVAGEVVTGETPEEARRMVDNNATMNVDFIKIRVDDNLGTTKKMTPPVYEAVIDQAKKHNLEVVAHIFYLEDAKALLRLGVKFIGHSVRDQLVDDEFISLMKENNAIYCPTLMREASTFIYESTPDFFSDPFFLSHADAAIIHQLETPERQLKVKESKSAQRYKEALVIAKENLKRLSDAGVKIAMGTDTGPPARFQGYFEHLELEQMVGAGLTPMQVIVAATGNAAYNNQSTQLGTLEKGKKADFIVLTKDPLIDIKNSRTIESVWVDGNKIQ
ncbi:MAG: amidohydrolase family protein [Cyclobacteriaceae bacterium]